MSCKEGQRTAIVRALGISPDNLFRLIEALGGDIAGAQTFLPQGDGSLLDYRRTAPDPLDRTEHTALLERLPRITMLAGG